MNILSAQATETQLAEAHQGLDANGDLVNPGPGEPEMCSQTPKVDGNATTAETPIQSPVVSPVVTQNPRSPAESKPAEELIESIKIDWSQNCVQMVWGCLGILSDITHAV